MSTKKKARNLEPGDVIESLGGKRRIVEIDKDREVPDEWDWCDEVWTAYFADDTGMTIFPHRMIEVF